MNIIAFGDIHGEYYKLKRLVEKIHISADDTLVFLGDYIDRGRHSFEVINYLIELGKQYDCVFLRGNHELMFMDYMSGINEDMFIWNGGVKTIDSYAQHGYDSARHNDYTERYIPKEHMEFFQNLKPYYETEGFVFVHAGVWPNTPLENLPDEILYWDRSYIYGSHADDYKGKVIVCGHTPSQDIMNEKHRICIDTGACFERMGKLTCVKLPEREFTQQGFVLEDLIDEKDSSSG